VYQPTRSPEVSFVAGFTLVEMVVAVAISSILMLSLADVVTNTLAMNDDSRERNALTRDARFAMERMVRAVSRTQRLLVPMADKQSTGHDESSFDPGVLAVTLDPTLDRDLDGSADADNDGDGRIDEDLPDDTSKDGKPGLIGIDDDNSGVADYFDSPPADDDESNDLQANEDPIDGIDDDGDQNIDEDQPGDMNGDGAAGIAGFDDDGDGLIDEGASTDDDEDGVNNEDWYDAVVYFLSGPNLIERFPNLAPVDGTDYTERIIAEDVTSFRIDRLPRGANRADLVEITLGLGAGNASVLVQQRVRVGGAP
jgi:prepilin-type N-terminal cleavage/methylation domain-containing protein